MDLDNQIDLARRRRKAAEWVGVSVGALCLVCLLSYQNDLGRIDFAINDVLSKADMRPPPADIVLVAIDEKSLLAIGHWPWRRALHAKLIDNISEDGAAAIGLDIVLTEPDRQHPYDDAVLAESIAKSTRVSLPLLTQYSMSQPSNPLMPLPELHSAAAHIGHVLLRIDHDGTVRCAIGYLVSEVGAIPSLAEAMVPAGFQGPLAQDGPCPWNIPFAGPDGHFRRISYVDVLKGEVPPGTFTNRYVLIGAASAGLGDAYPVAVRGLTQLMSGMEIQANMLDALLRQKMVRPASTLANTLFNALPVALGLLTLVFLSPTASLLASVICVVAQLSLAWFLRIHELLAYKPAASFLVLAMIHPIWIWRRFAMTTSHLLAESRRCHSLLGTQTAAVPGTRNQLLGDPLERRILELEVITKKMQQIYLFNQKIIDNLPSATLVLDNNSCILLCNFLALKYMKSLDQCLVGRPAHEFLRGLQNSRTFQTIDVHELIRDSTDTFSVECTDQGGHSLLLNGAKYSILENLEELNCILSLIDITELRGAERSRDDALCFLTHDLRSPQSSMLATIENYRSTNNASIDQLLTTMERYAKKTLSLADSFVYWSKAQVPNYKFEIVDLNSLVWSSIDEVWPRAERLSVRIEAAYSIGPAMCSLDVDMMTRAISNLLDNAVKYSQKYGVVHCSVTSTADKWCLQIQDDGIGISEKSSQNLFLPFRQIHDAESQLPGFGLGLAFVKSVANMHGASIEMKSVVGVGTTFSLLIASLPAGSAVA